MSGLNTLVGQIKNPRSEIYRRLYIKRRRADNGLYEDDWVEITDDVIKWGNIKKEIDSVRINQFKFSNLTLTLDNSEGRYNPYVDDNSIWNGYGDEQRTLVKIEAGFLYKTKTNGVWTVTELPSSNVVYNGFISGDINIKGNNQISIPVVPLQECFRQFSARRLTGWNTSLTASDFIMMLRDQQDTSGNYIFRPFFQNTTTGWSITSTTAEYSNLNTGTAADVINATVWDVVTKLAEAENYIPWVTNDGRFVFGPRDVNTTTVYEFYGVGTFSNYYGQNIKKINWFGKRYSKYYSRVSVKWVDADTATSYEIEESQYLVNSTSAPWTLGERTLQIDNYWIPNASIASDIATALFTEFSAIKNEIEFATPFIPDLDIFDRVLISYDSSPIQGNALWDLNNWGDTTSGSNPDDLFWDATSGEAIKLQQDEFQLISIDMNLDNLECKFIGRA